MSLQKRNTQNLTLKEENSSRFYSWGITADCSKESLFTSVLPRLLFFVAIKRLFSLRALQLEFVKKVHPPLLGDDGGVVIVGLLILSYQANCWLARYNMGRGVVDLCWTCLKTCLELPKSRYLSYLIAIWWINSKVPKGSMITSENSSVARESSRVIILK